MILSKLLGNCALGSYTLGQRVSRKLFSLAIAGAFYQFESGSIIAPPLRISGARYISLKSGVFIGAGSWLLAMPQTQKTGTLIEIGSACSFAGGITISAAIGVEIGDSVLIARNVYISDHSHSFADKNRPILVQGIDRLSPVRIGKGTWIGQNAVILPGVEIGEGCVVGANSVVRDSIDDFSIVAGAPARVIRKRS